MKDYIKNTLIGVTILSSFYAGLYSGYRGKDLLDNLGKYDCEFTEHKMSSERLIEYKLTGKCHDITDLFGLDQ